MDGKLAREIIYLLLRAHQMSAYITRVPNGNVAVEMLKATKLSKELKAWLVERQGEQTDETFRAAVDKLFQGNEVKL